MSEGQLLEGRVALITGGGGEIGGAVVERAYQMPVRIVERLKALQQQK